MPIKCVFFFYSFREHKNRVSRITTNSMITTYEYESFDFVEKVNPYCKMTHVLKKILETIFFQFEYEN